MDKEEISFIYQEYGTIILRMCYIYLGTRELAEDALQETFLRVCRSYSEYRNESSMKTWLTRIAINVCLNMLKANKNSKETSMYDSDNNLIEFPGAESAVDVELKLSLSEYINGLPLDLRQVVIMFYYMEYNTREISELLDMKRSKVEFYLKKARKLLSKKIKGGFQNEEHFGQGNGSIGFECR